MNKKLLGGILAAGLSVATLGALPLGAEAGNTVKASTALTASDRANEAGRNLIKSKAPQLKVSATEKFSLIGDVVSTTDGLQYAAYNRTYGGLPVIGGDFVVTTNNKGQILATSVAQKAKIGSLSVKPTVSAAKAASVTKAQVTKVVKTTSPKLVVWSLSGKPRLAWETSVSGEQAGKTAVRKVFVDARTGKLIKVVDEVAHGEGTGYYNGPNPLPITVSQSGTTYSMTSPNIDGFTCQDAANNSTFTGPDDKFGNGQQTSRETGCADAYYAVEQENGMLSDWLGRDSFGRRGRRLAAARRPRRRQRLLLPEQPALWRSAGPDRPQPGRRQQLDQRHGTSSPTRWVTASTTTPWFGWRLRRQGPRVRRRCIGHP